MCRTKKELVTGQQKKVVKAAKDEDNLELDKEASGLMSITMIKCQQGQ